MNLHNGSGFRAVYGPFNDCWKLQFPLDVAKQDLISKIVLWVKLKLVMQ